MAGKDNRTEKPTQKRIRKAYEDGNIVRSQEVGQALSLAAFMLWSGFAGGAFLYGLMNVVRRGIAAAAKPDDPSALVTAFSSTMLAGAKLTAPLLAGFLLFALVGAFLQGIHPKKNWLKFDLNRLNPVTGLGRFVSVEKLLTAFKAILRTALYALIALAIVMPEWRHVAGMALLSPAAIFKGGMAIVGRILSRVLLLGLVVAAADFALARHRWQRGLMMTKQEVKDEMKESENPEIKSRIRGKQREIARRRMMAAVRTANVVVTNPTHVAVALQYDRTKMAAPVVVAKGFDHIAQRIKEEARKYNVPIIEDPPLARMLEKLCPLGAAVPEALYRAVAEVLAYVFRRGRGPYRPHPEVETGDDAAAGDRP